MDAIDNSWAADAAASRNHHPGAEIDAEQPGAPVASPRGVSLLELDPGLGSRLGEDQRAQARRHACLATIELRTGRWELDELRADEAVRGEVRGFLLLSGALAAEVAIVGRMCTRLFVPQELVLLDGSDTGSIPAKWGWSVLETAQIAVLDDRLLVIARHWPLLLSALLERAGQETRYALLQQAISQLPRVEHRLLALLWSIADRRGVVRPDGVWVSLPLTHETIARMIGARRPTVSLGLRALVNQRLVRAEKDGWLIDRDSLRYLQPERPPLLLDVDDPAHNGAASANGGAVTD